MDKYSSAISYDIDPCKHFEQNCIDDVIATLANWLDRKHFLMYARLWDFDFHPADKDKGNLGDSMYIEPNHYIYDLEKYHGIKSTTYETDSSADGLEIILQQLYSGFPAVATMDSFWVPWDENYQTNHIIHSFIVTGYEPKEKCLLVTDSYFMVKGGKFPIELFHKSFLKVSTFKVIRDEAKDWHYIKNDLYNWIKYVKEDKCIFSQMKTFAESLKTKFDMGIETAGYSHFTDVPLFSELGKVADGRIKFAQFLAYVGELYDPSFQKISELMKEAAANWGVIRGSLIKMNLTNSINDRNLDKLAVRIQQSSDYEQDLAEQIMTYLMALQEGSTEQITLTSFDKNILTDYVKPISEIEKGIAQVWQEVLDKKNIGIRDDFFELGGQSLHALACTSIFKKEFGIDIPVTSIFQYPTISELAPMLEQGTKMSYQSIPPADDKEYYPVTSQQKRIYLLHEFGGAEIGYNIPSGLMIQDELDTKRLQSVIQQIIDRHEALRTTFHFIDGEPKQKIHKKLSCDLLQANIKDFAGETEQERIKAVVARFVQPSKLDEGPLAKFALVKFRQGLFLFLVDIHHIIADGVSLEILNREFIALYQGKSLQQLRVQYKDYAVWQHKQLQSESMLKQEEFWLNNLQGIPQNASLPTDFLKPAKQTFSGRRLTFNIQKEIVHRLKKLCSQADSTMYMVLLAFYSILISAYTREKDVVVGSPIAGRSHSNVESVFGMFVNTLAMRNQVDSELSVIEFIEHVKKNSLQAYDNQDYPFELLVEKLNLHRDISENPVFDTLFVFQNIDTRDGWQDVEFVTSYEFDHGVSKFDLSLELTERDGILQGCVDYRTDLFLESTIKLFIDHFLALLDNATLNSDTKIEDLSMVSMDEKSKLLNNGQVWNEDTQYQHYTVHELFEKQVMSSPDSIAVVDGNRNISYRELNDMAQQIAVTLNQSGVGSESIIAILMDRSVEMIAVLLGVLKAGGAYVPIDADYPEERILFMLEDTQTEWLVTHRFNSPKVKFGKKHLYVEELLSRNDELMELPDTIKVLPENLAYVIYTSGTTGQPKGVMIEHRNVVNLLTQSSKLFCFTEEDVFTMFHSYCFDFSVWEMYAALLNGGKLVLVPKDVTQEPHKFIELVRSEKVTILNQTPSAFYAFIQAAEQKKINYAPRIVIFGGEALKPGLLMKWKESASKTRLINMYGITETTVHVTFKEITDNEIRNNLSIIGKPLSGYQVYVCNENGKLVPMGVPGELYVGGSGVARGYLNRLELTNERFIQLSEPKGLILYRTGDSVRMHPNGELEYLGRIDHQVKIRGYRIETSEVENCLLKHKHVQEAVVIAIEDDSGTKELCAYVVLEKAVSYEELRKHMERIVPSYMIPAVFLNLEQMPLTSNGKVNRKGLPRPDLNMRLGISYTAPSDEVENILVQIWKEILKKDDIGVRDDFFALGGHSLIAAEITAMIWKRFGVQVSLRQIFESPTIRALSELVKRLDKGSVIDIQPAPKAEVYPVSSAQRRMMLLQEIEGIEDTYNVPSCFILEGMLDIKQVEVALQRLIQRHEILRTQFEWRGGQGVQRVLDKVSFELEVIEEKTEYWVREFNLSKAPLIRVGLQKIDRDRHMLVIDLHHIITDGLSMNNLIRDFAAFYAEEPLPEMRIQYKDYAVWEKNLLKSEDIRRQELYWKEQFSEEIPILELPYDRPRPPVKSFAGSQYQFMADKELTDKLKQLSKETDTTTYMLLMAVFTVFLQKLSEQKDIIIGSPVAGRPHADLLPILGLFVNTLALRYSINPELPFTSHLQHVKETTLKSFEHQMYPFDQLIEELDISRDMSRSAMFDVMFLLQNMEDQQIQLDGLSIYLEKKDTLTSKFDLTLMVEEHDERFAFTFEYATSLFDESTIIQFGQRFMLILEEVTNQPHVKLEELQMLTNAEKEFVLNVNKDEVIIDTDFNWQLD